jgi:histidinol dehydrogenase
VQSILDAVKEDGDEALARYAEKFDGFVPPSWRLSVQERDAIAATTPPALRSAIDRAIGTIGTFHRAQGQEELPVETAPGVRCWRRAIPIERVGLYVPGGSAPLFSTLIMLAVPARVVGCKEIVLTTPLRKPGMAPAIAYAAKQLGIDEIYLIGGAQGIAALAYGTESIRPVCKICGPGNRFVTEAKVQLASLGFPIDLPAGPSEVLVIADDTADPAFVAADLLAQAEHGPDSQVVLVTTSEVVVDSVDAEVTRQLSLLPRKAIAARALEESLSVLVNTLEEAMAFSNAYAPEHLILAVEEPERLVPLVQNAGSVFVGALSPESLGDYASGTNHVLPTAGLARAWSGVSTDTFVKKVTFQRVDKHGLLELGPAVVEMATAEGLVAHARAVSIRLEKIS